MARYDRAYDRAYGRAQGRRYGYDLGYGRPGPFTGWYPGAFAAGAPLFGWAGWEGAGVWGWPPYAPIGYGGAYGYDYTRRRRPEESPTYGRAADEAARRFARSHGYDEGIALRPHFRDTPARDYGRYDGRFRRR